MKRLRAGVVGVGHLGQHHARILAATPGVELVGVVDASLERAAAIAEKCSTRAFDDPRRLLGAVDVVSIAAPTVHHREVAEPFLARGTATLIEKPIAGSLAEAEQIVALARASGALLQVGHIERFNPVLRALEGGAVRPRFIHAERLSTYTFRSTDIGVVFDLMIHDLDLVLAMVNAPVRSVAAVGVGLFGAHEDVANARIDFEDGTVANLTASRASYVSARKMRIWSAEGYASLDFATRTATTVRPSDQLRRGKLDMNGVDLAQPAAIREHLFSQVLHKHETHYDDPTEPLALELQEFVAAARAHSTFGPVGNGVRPRVDGETALRAVRLADQILQSLERHRWDGAEAPSDALADAAAAAALPLTPSAFPNEPSPALQGPHAWRIKSLRHAPNSNAARE